MSPFPTVTNVPFPYASPLQLKKFSLFAAITCEGFIQKLGIKLRVKAGWDTPINP
jgi:hypothetical protein